RDSHFVNHALKIISHEAGSHAASYDPWSDIPRTIGSLKEGSLDLRGTLKLIFQITRAFQPKREFVSRGGRGRAVPLVRVDRLDASDTSKQAPSVTNPNLKAVGNRLFAHK